MSHKKKPMRGAQAGPEGAKALMGQTRRVSSLTKSRSGLLDVSEGSSGGRSRKTSTTATSPRMVSPRTTLRGAEREEEEVQRYLRSRQLTSLVTLRRPPYAGYNVSVADVGDPNGHPVFVFLGLGAVRYLVGLYDEMATVLRLRLICVDRWGQGQTDDVPADRRGVLEWSSVVAEVADQLQVSRFSILAHSAGAPYAMATTLMYGARVAGPVHLLAPWVSPTIESGYKWLKYIPDGLIKTAQAADWRMQAWKLGLGKSSSNHSDWPREAEDDDNDAADDYNEQHADRSHTSDGSYIEDSYAERPSGDTSLPDSVQNFSLHLDRGSSDDLRDKNDDEQEASRWSTSAETSSLRRSNSFTPASKKGSFIGRGKASTPSATLMRTDARLSPSHSCIDSMQAQQTMYLSNSSNSIPSTPKKRQPPAMVRSLSERDGGKTTPSSRTPSSTKGGSSPISSSASGLDLATALLKASHAESLRGGGSNDLLVILGRSSQRPWGFSYTDVKHPVSVWYGDKDERINMTSILWMQREMDHCSVKIVEGASHSLMTNGSVVIEALERISTYRSD